MREIRRYGSAPRVCLMPYSMPATGTTYWAQRLRRGCIRSWSFFGGRALSSESALLNVGPYRGVSGLAGVGPPGYRDI